MKPKILIWLDQFVTQIEADGRSPHTIAQYERHVRRLAEWVGRHYVKRIDHEVLARFLVSDAARLRPDGNPWKSAHRSTRTNLRVTRDPPTSP